MTTYTYADAYLKGQITDARELQAETDVTQHGPLPELWTNRLVVLRAYIIACIECMKSTDDTFAAKLSAYRKDYADTLALARAAQAAIDAEAGGTGGGSMFTVPIERA